VALDLIVDRTVLIVRLLLRVRDLN